MKWYKFPDKIPKKNKPIILIMNHTIHVGRIIYDWEDDCELLRIEGNNTAIRSLDFYKDEDIEIPSHDYINLDWLIKKHEFGEPSLEYWAYLSLEKLFLKNEVRISDLNPIFEKDWEPHTTGYEWQKIAKQYGNSNFVDQPPKA